jgi:hypothetical protein
MSVARDSVHGNVKVSVSSLPSPQHGHIHLITGLVVQVEEELRRAVGRRLPFAIEGHDHVVLAEAELLNRRRAFVPTNPIFAMAGPAPALSSLGASYPACRTDESVSHSIRAVRKPFQG